MNPVPPRTLSKREAKRLAVLVIQDVIDVTISTGAETQFHPETNARLAYHDDQAIRSAMRAIWQRTEDRLARAVPRRGGA